MSSYQKKILITGISGFIGKAVCERLSKESSVIGIDNNVKHKVQNVTLNHSDITDYEKISKFVNMHKPDIVIHCAGIAHQKIGTVDSNEYFRVNSYSTENLAKIANKANHNVYFIFLSSISVYGEDNMQNSVPEDSQCNPSSDYASSKLDAEKRLIALYNSGGLNKLDIFRLAPVYDSEWSLNLDRRVFAPKKIAYIKFGSGNQKMSAVSRKNLLAFIEYRLNQVSGNSKDSCFINILNICDKEAYRFKEIIRVFKKSSYHPDRFVFTIPLFIVWMLTRVAGFILRSKRQWLHSCYDKLAYSLVFSNDKMLDTGFEPHHNLHTVFLQNE
jgi:nucleoside-diphosphate-sugar epimerase